MKRPIAHRDPGLDHRYLFAPAKQIVSTRGLKRILGEQGHPKGAIDGFRAGVGVDVQRVRKKPNHIVVSSRDSGIVRFLQPHDVGAHLSY